MVNIGFLLNFPVDYKGGINYFKNIFSAVDAADDKEVYIKLFVPSAIDDEYLKLFSNVEIVQTPILKRGTLPWLVDKVFGKIFGYHILTERLLNKHQINVLSHSNIISKSRSVKNVNWIPDFQYKHYPQLWTEKQLANTEKLHSYLIHNSERIIVSSYDAYEDLAKSYPNETEKVSVLHFVSQPFHVLNTLAIAHLKEQITSYTENSKYFYLPNQFWSHKNHLTVFKACKILKDKHYQFKLITSGFMKDYRNNDHVNMLISYVKEQDMENEIKFLGLIPYEHVFSLNLFSLALINPSYFEGWSSTVEEAKTIGTKTIISNINVHKEQNPPGALYFNPDSADALAEQMEKVLLAESPSTKDFNALHAKLLTDTKNFGQVYINIIKEVADL
jgi:glycosyltransferase involved in cell wall biosynthesis